MWRCLHRGEKEMTPGWSDHQCECVRASSLKYSALHAHFLRELLHTIVLWVWRNSENIIITKWLTCSLCSQATSSWFHARLAYWKGTYCTLCVNLKSGIFPPSLSLSFSRNPINEVNNYCTQNTYQMCVVLRSCNLLPYGICFYKNTSGVRYPLQSCTAKC